MGFMVIKVEAVVYEYSECLHCILDGYEGDQRICSKEGRNIMHRSIDAEKIPEWCPLSTK